MPRARSPLLAGRVTSIVKRQMTPPADDELPQVPAALGSSWDVFVRDWWLNAALPDTPESMARALSVLWRLWPERILEVARASARGPGMVAPLLDLGLILELSEPIPSFAEVLFRLKGGERSAQSELVLVAALTKLSLAPSFAPPIDGRVLDAACMVGSNRVFFEVVAPERSDAGQARMKIINRLSEGVRAAIAGCRVEIEVFDEYTDGDISVVVEAIALAPPNAWALVENKARLRRIDTGQRLLPLFDRPDGMQMVIAGEQAVQGESASAVICHEDSDGRAKRVFNEEYHQFSKAVPNVLVVNVSAVSGGMREWPIHMSRLLQPGRNRRVGAVAFFDQGVIGPPERTRRRWRILANPYAHCAVPDSLLAGLESLDESQFYGLPRFDRLTVAV